MRLLLSIRNYLRLAAPEPEILLVLGKQSQVKGTDKLASRRIDKIIGATGARPSKRP